LIRVGWPKKFVEESIPKLQISGFKGDNLLNPSENMPWWKGVDVKVGSKTIHVHTLLDVLENMVVGPRTSSNIINENTNLWNL